MAESSTSTAPGQQPVDPAASIVPDEDPYASSDPAFLTDSDAASSTQSLSSSVLNYQYENGRRYNAYREGEYMGPNDDKEQDRMDLHHHIYRLLVDGALFRAPIDLRTARILDLGTGTGIWPMEIADDYPGATIIGTDLSPIQPGWVPPNCYFELNDFESPWEFSKPFDFIHGRTLAGSVRDFPQLFERTLENLNPGGWAEFVDFICQAWSDDDSLKKAPNVVKWIKLLNEASDRFGKSMNVALRYKQWMIDAGFKDVREEAYKVPLNPWAKNPKLKEIGRFQQVNMLEGQETFTLALFTRVLGWSAEEVTVFLADVRKELVDRSIHIYGKFFFVYGQKQGE
ncbi:Methyltransferase [Aspergillus sp. HF37]|nr:Methyltransferase [Aspergillus sp. HF37]